MALLLLTSGHARKPPQSSPSLPPTSFEVGRLLGLFVVLGRALIGGRSAEGSQLSGGQRSPAGSAAPPVGELPQISQELLQKVPPAPASQGDAVQERQRVLGLTGDQAIPSEAEGLWWSNETSFPEKSKDHKKGGTET